MSLTIKAFLYEVSWRGDPSEIRRFTVDQDVSTSFTYLLEKIAQVFPSVQTTNVVVAWMDSDGDLIVISSDEELVEALDQFDGDVFRLYLKKRNTQSTPNAFGGPPREPKPILESDDEEEKSGEKTGQPQTEQQQSTNQEQGPLHPGVQCDGCNGTVRGTRYKCLVCHDYDLCSTCEAKGVHVEHNMVSITEPFSYSPWGSQGGRGCWARGGGGHPGRGRWGHHGGHHGHGWFGQQPFPPFFGGQWWGQPCGAPQCPPWGLGTPLGGHPYFRRGGCHGRRGWRQGCQQNTENSCRQNGCKPQEAGKEPTDPKPESMETEETPERNEEERRSYLRGVGEAVSSFLEPFGIKVDVDVAGGANATANSEQQEADTPEVSSDVVEQALAQLKTMGYEDEGGWLTELVKAKGGDIGKVLDALHPSTTDV